jgi:hypothetical protein
MYMDIKKTIDPEIATTNKYAIRVFNVSILNAPFRPLLKESLALSGLHLYEINLTPIQLLV